MKLETVVPWGRSLAKCRRRSDLSGRGAVCCNAAGRTVPYEFQRGGNQMLRLVAA